MTFVSEKDARFGTLQHNHGYGSLGVLLDVRFHRMEKRRGEKEFYSSPTPLLPG